jgi:hypothetical protein
MTQRFQESEPDEERSERQAVESVPVAVEPRDHAIVQLAEERTVGRADVTHRSRDIKQGRTEGRFV